MSDAEVSTDQPPVVEAPVDTPEVQTVAAPGPGRDRWKYTVPGGLLRAVRPRQWIKNVLVFAAPGAAGLSLTVDNAAPVLGAFVAWCLVSSGTYLINDAMDAEADRLHPRKRLRAVASGVVSIGTAQVA